MGEETIVLDVRNLEDCKLRQKNEVLQEIFQDAEEQLAKGREIVLWQTFDDSPPEVLERIKSAERLREIRRYYIG
jgi:hypothetical protein